MSRIRSKPGSLVNALLSLSINDTDDCNYDNINQTIHEQPEQSKKLFVIKSDGDSFSRFFIFQKVEINEFDNL